MDKQLENTLRNLKLDLLSFLNVLSVTDAIALELDEISQSTSTAETDLRGIISTLRRIKVDEECIIVPAGRDDRGRLRWKINEKVVNKNDLADFLSSEIFGQTVMNTTNVYLAKGKNTK